MEFITAEQFLKEDKEVQEVFINWWKPKIGDLFKYNYGYSNIEIINLKSIKEDVEESKYSAHIIPLLTEGQLRQFIEDKIKTKLRIIPTNIGYRIIYLPGKGTDLIDKCYEGDLLQAYWKVAVQIAKESIKH